MQNLFAFLLFSFFLVKKLLVWKLFSLGGANEKPGGTRGSRKLWYMAACPTLRTKGLQI